ncbi:serine hydrolase domain-containing protein [Paenibacillus pabuli]|uniref:serine hydrolase domain-containing protein n=1 Tax=Paenibacillus pabuli TaxID=1472 RepID=UPI00078242B4|nr:serine hydrolase domain-containing protein [Paenibacillus pabuli]MEC0128751.1 serine hydrolase [Paenibacillus pabuli]
MSILKKAPVLLVIILCIWSPGLSSAENVGDFKLHLDRKMPQLQQKYGVAGVAVGIVQDGKPAYILHYGYADQSRKIALNEDTLFQAGSISKSLTAWGILHLVEEGKLSLDDPVDKFLTRWHLPDGVYSQKEVTIRRLLSHTAGLSAHRGYLGTAPGKPLSTIEESLSGKGLLNTPLTIDHKPGTEPLYSGAGYTLLQLVIEEITGMPFDRYMDEQVMQPLDMQHSTFQQNPANPKLSKAYGYFGQQIPTYQFTEQAAAGLQTTASDMVKLILTSMESKNNDHQGRGVISSKLVKEMQTPVISENGLGIFSRTLSNQTTLLYHPGDNRGWHSFYGWIPSTGDGLVILTNSETGVDLRQEVYHDWIESQTGIRPEKQDALMQAQRVNALIAIVLGAWVSAYLLLFCISLFQGKRLFITKQPHKHVVRLAFRSIMLVLISSALFYLSYAATLVDLHSGKKSILVCILIWFGAWFVTGFFPKKKIHINRITKMDSPEL